MSIKNINQYVNNPSAFIERFVKITNINQGEMPFLLNDDQRDIIDCIHNSDNLEVEMFKRRQCGKTSIVLAYMIFLSTFNNHKTMAIVCRKRDAALDVLTTFKKMYTSLPEDMKHKITHEDKNLVEFENGIRILICPTQDSFRGRHISFINCDEHDWIEDLAERLKWVKLSMQKGSKIVKVSSKNELA